MLLQKPLSGIVQYRIAVRLLMLLLNLPMAASLPQVCHGHWHEENGLPGNSVLSLAQTPDGYIWLGMENGLVRFDGIRFHRCPLNGESALTGHLVSQCLTDQGGALWIGTMDQGLIRHSSGHFVRYTSEKGLCSNQITCLLEASDRTLWIGSRRGLNRLNNGVLRRIELPEGQCSAHISSIIEDHKGYLWVATYDQGLMRFSEREQNLEIETVPRIDADINVLHALDDETVWIGTMGRGLYRFNTNTKTFRRELQPGDVSITCIFTDVEQNLWIGTYGDGIYVKPKDQDVIVPFHPGSEELPSKIISAFLQDREYSIWVATLGGGILNLRKGVISTLTTKTGLSGDIIFGVFEDSRGRIWSGSIGGGVNCTDDSGTTTLTAAQGFPSQSVLCFSESGDGSIWMGAVGHGLLRLQGSKIRIYDDDDGLPDKLIRSLYTDRQDRLWIGTQQGNLYRMEHERFVRLLHLDARINHIYQVPNGDILLCTMGQGVVVYSDDPSRPRYFPMRDLPGTLYTCALLDQTGNLWLAAIGQGLVMKGEDGLIRLFTRKEGLPDHTIYVILEDETGRIWCSSNHGIFSISRQSIMSNLMNPQKPLHISIYGKESGMRSHECNGGSQPAGLRDRLGRLWFPTIKGLARLTPAHIHINLTPPSVLVEKLELDGKSYNPAYPVEVHSKRSELKIDFAAISFVYPQRVRYRYQLEGFDRNWLDGQSERSIRYQNIPSGRYRFRLLAANADGLWNTEETGFALTLRPFFYQTWLFKAILLVFLMGISVVLHLYLRRRYLRQRLKPKYTQSLINPVEADSQLKMLVRLVEGERLYRQASLSVGDLSRRTLLTTRTISQILNERRQQNFFEFINSFRIHEAREIIADPLRRRHRSLLEIAYAVGFNSKSAFNRAFKHFYGHTPSELKNKNKPRIIPKKKG